MGYREIENETRSIGCSRCGHTEGKIGSAPRKWFHVGREILCGECWTPPEVKAEQEKTYRRKCQNLKKARKARDQKRKIKQEDQG